MPCSIYRRESTNAQKASDISTKTTFYVVDGFVCKMASTIQGSTDTTIYVLCLYFTSVGVSKWKHALKVGLFADVVGISIGILLSIIFLK